MVIIQKRNFEIHSKIQHKAKRTCNIICHVIYCQCFEEWSDNRTYRQWKREDNCCNGSGIESCWTGAEGIDASVY